MTMRQVVGLLGAIRKSVNTDFYVQVLSYALVHGVKLPSLDEYLALTSDKEANAPKPFDEKADKFLEEQAQKRLKEMTAQYGK